MRGTISPEVKGRYLYRYADHNELDSHATYLRGHGLDSGAETWSALVWGLLRLRHPFLLNSISFDEESDCLAIWSEEQQVLRYIDRLIDEAKRDPQLFDEALAIADEFWGALAFR